MKLTNARKLLLVLYLFVVGFFVEATVTGCRNAPGTAYTTATVATVTVEAAISGPWAAYVAEKHPPKSEEIRVATAFLHYKQADIALLKAGRGVLEAQQAIPPDPNNVNNATVNWQIASAALVDAANNVYIILKSLGVKLP